MVAHFIHKWEFIVDKIWCIFCCDLSTYRASWRWCTTNLILRTFKAPPQPATHFQRWLFPISLRDFTRFDSFHNLSIACCKQFSFFSKASYRNVFPTRPWEPGVSCSPWESEEAPSIVGIPVITGCKYALHHTVFMWKCWLKQNPSSSAVNNTKIFIYKIFILEFVSHKSSNIIT